MHRLAWKLLGLVALTGPVLVGCGDGYIINASTVNYVQFHGTMPNAGSANAASKTPGQVNKKRVIPAHLSESVGLADTQAFIEQAWGKPSKVVVPVDGKGNGSAYYKGGSILVQYVDGRAADLTWKTKPSVSITQAERIARGMLPKDAVLAQTITVTGQPQMVQQWSSARIKDVWQMDNEVPGYASVLFALNGNSVSTFEISLGQQV